MIKRVYSTLLTASIQKIMKRLNKFSLKKRCKAPSPVSIYGGECQIRKL